MFSSWLKSGAVAAGVMVGVTGGALRTPAAHAQAAVYGDMTGQDGDQVVDDSQVEYGQDQDQGQVDTASFDATLTPYGTWQDTEAYGRVWRPDPYVVGTDFVPYSTGGRWVYTDYGWAWQSDWNWGWAPFHYGRWALDPVLGWIWAPGSVWAPAWVDWRYGGGYVGWCPLGPGGVTVSYGYGYGYGYRPYWNFVETRYFVEPNPVHYAVPVGRVHTAMSVTQPIGSTVGFHGAHWNAGPPPGHIASATGRQIVPVGVRPPPPGQIAMVRPGFTAPVSRPAPAGGFGTGQRYAGQASGAWGGNASRPSPGFTSSGGYERQPPAGFRSPSQPAHEGGFSRPPEGYGQREAPPAGFGSQQPAREGGFAPHGAPPAPAEGFHGGGYGQGGGFHAPPAGGFHGGGGSAPRAGGGGGGGGGHPPAGFHGPKH
jgi:hypothetical protein